MFTKVTVKTKSGRIVPIMETHVPSAGLHCAAFKLIKINSVYVNAASRKTGHCSKRSEKFKIKLNNTINKVI